MNDEIASTLMEICDRVYPFTDELDPMLGMIYAQACRIDGADSIKHAASGMMNVDNPFERVRSCASSVVEGWSGWSAVMSNDLRMPEYIVDLLEYSDYTYYAAHMKRDLPGFYELDPDGRAMECLDEITGAHADIVEAIEPLVGKYSPYR